MTRCSGFKVGFFFSFISIPRFRCAPTISYATSPQVPLDEIEFYKNDEENQFFKRNTTPLIKKIEIKTNKKYDYKTSRIFYHYSLASNVFS